MKNTFVKVLSMMMALMMVVGILTVVPATAAECNHTKGEYIDGQEPTCQTPGFSRYICGECGEEWITDVIQASDEYHNIQTVDAVPASCLTAGYSAGKRCLVPGCTEVAEGCEIVAPAKAHTFVGKEVAPTCFDQGWVVYTCTSCQKTAETLNTEGKFLAAGQTYAQYQKVATGKTQLVHAYTWEIVNAPVNTNGTCANGSAKGVCANCGDVKTAEIPVVHTWVSLNPDNLPCIAWTQASMKCSNCGVAKAGNQTQPTVGHNAVTTYDVTFEPESAAFKATGLKLQDLYNLGFSVGDKLTVAATCTNAGYALVKCSCGHLYIKTEAVKAHTYGEWGSVQWPTKCTDPAVRERTCSCGKKDTKVIVEAAAATHAIKNTVTAPNCTELGYTVTTCTNKFIANGVEITCNHNVKGSYVDATGHNFGAAQYVSGTCGSATYQKKCQNANCNATQDAVEPDANKNHAYGAETVVPSTCKTLSYKLKVCATCGNRVETAIDGAVLDPNNHEYEDKLDGLGNIQYVGAAPTCTTTGTKIVWCSTHGDATIKTVEAPKAAHVYSYNYIAVEDGVQVAKAGALPATCQSVGYQNDGEVCVCLAVKKPATVIPVDKTAHTSKTAVGAPVAATCQEGAYQLYNTPCCGLVKDYTSGVIACSFTVIVPFAAPTCTAAGNHQYTKCSMCGAKQAFSTVATGCTYGCTDDAHALLSVTDIATIPALGHNYQKVNAQKAPNCESTGKSEYQDCARCDFVKFNNVEYNTAIVEQNAAFTTAITVPAHYNAYKQEFVTRPSSCTATGIVGGTYCTVCQAGAWIDPIDPHVYSSEFTVNYANGNRIDCTKDACIVRECACTAKTTEYFTAADNQHNMTNWADETFTGVSCKDDRMQKRYCQDCATGVTVEYRVKEGGAATGCYTTKGVTGGQKYYISYNCDEIAGFIGWSCDVCHDTVDDSDLKHYELVTDSKAATCTENGYNISYCPGCGLTEKAGAIDFVEPTIEVVEPADGDYVHDEANGIVLETTADFVKYICADCGETITRNIPKPTPAPVFKTTLTTGAAVVTAGEKTTLTIAISLANQTVKFNVLELVLNTADQFAVSDVNATVTGFGTDVEVIAAGNNIMIYPANTAELVTLTADSNVSVTLTLEAKGVAYGDRQITVASATAKTVNNNGVVTPTAVAGLTNAAAKVKVSALGNVNGDTLLGKEEINAADYRETYLYAQKVVTGEAEYSVKYDINRDGVVNMNDARVLKTFVLSNKTVADYLNMLNYEFDSLTGVSATANYTAVIGMDLASVIVINAD